MRSGGCWSSVVATVQERAALRLTPTHDWLIACVLPAGHSGAHASDGAQEHTGRRRWLLWGDYARGAQNLADEFECSAQALDGAPCMFFAGHGGHHRYAAPLGEDFPSASAPRTPMSSPASAQSEAAASPLFQSPSPLSDDGGRHAGRHGGSAQGGPTTPVRPPWMAVGPGAHQAASPNHGAGAPGPVGAAPESRRSPQMPPPLPPEDESVSLASLDALFAGMPSLKDLPHTDLLGYPEGSFRSAAPTWPDSRGEYVAEHRMASPGDHEVIVSGPHRFEPAERVPEDEIIDVEEVPDPVHGRPQRAPGDRGSEETGRAAAPTGGRHGAPTVADAATPETDPSSDVADADRDQRDTRWLHVRPGAASVLTTPMVEVISSNDDPVRMGVPTARRRLAVDDDELTSVTAAVEEAADRLRSLPDADGEVSAALQDVGQALSRLSEILRTR